MFQALKIEPNLPIQYYVQCSHWAFIWSIYWCAINRIKRLCWIVWWNNKYHFIYFSTSSVFYKDLNIKHPISTQQHVEKIAPNMFKDKTLLLPFIAFILLHIGQWMYTMNMPLFVTDYLKENEQHVGYLASLCAGLEVPFMIILGVLSSRLQTRTLLIYGAIFGGLFYFSIGVFKTSI